MEGEKIRILLIEDNPGDARLIRELLNVKDGASFDLEHTDRLSTALARLARGNIDVILLDLSLPDSQGLDGLNKICAQTPKVPVVVLSGLSDEMLAVNAVHEGAQDYLVKGSVDSALLVRSLHYAIERQHLRVALRESEARYRLLADNAADLIWTANMKWQISYVSPSIKRLLGYTVEEMKRLSIKDILTPDSLKQAGKLIRNQMDIITPRSQYPPMSLTLEHVRKDGTTLWAEVMLSFLWDKDGKLSEVLGVTREITERKKAEEALRQSEQRYRLLAENVKDIIWTRDMNLRTTYVSPSVTQMSGYSVEEVMSLSMEESMTPASLEIVKSALSKVMAEVKEQRDLSEAVALEVELIHKNGSITPVEMKVSLLHDSEGRITGFLGVTREITERKKAEEALRESQEELQAIFDSSMNGIALLDLDGRVIRVNKRVLEVGGYDTDDLSGKPLDLLKMFTPESIERMSSVRDMILSGKESAAFECELCTKSGTKMSLEVNVGPFLLKGKLFGIVAVMRDITERKRMEDALRESEEKHRLYFENASDVIYSVDPEGTILSVSPAVERLLGYKPEELIGKNMADLNIVPPEKLEQGLIDTMHALAGERFISSDGEFFAKDGSVKFGEISGAPIFSRDGKVIAAICVARDITERKKMEQELLRLSDAMKMSTDSIVITDLEGNIVDVNEATLREQGAVSKAELVGLTPFDAIAPEDQESALSNLRKVLEDGYVREVQYHVLTRDGRKLFVETNVSVMKDKNGEPVGLVAVSRDITERKRMEEALQQSEHNYRILFEGTIDGMFVTDIETVKIVLANQTAAKMCGFDSAENTIGLNPLDLVHPNDRERVLGFFMEDASGESNQEVHEFRAITKDGREIWLGGMGTRIEYGGKPAVLSSVRDITERKRMEEALKQSEQDFRTLFDTTIDGIAVIDAETLKILLINQAIINKYGKDIIGMNPFDLLAPEEKERALKLLKEEVLEKDLRQVHEYRAIANDGSELWISVVSTRTEFQGRPAVLISIRNITEQRKAEQEVRRLSDAVRMSNDSIVLSDLEGRIVDANDATLKMHGLSNRTDLIGRLALELIVPEDHEMLTEKMTTAVAEGGLPFILEYHCIKNDGSIFLCEATISEVKDRNGEHTGYVAIGRDITERKRMEEELRASEQNYREVFDSTIDGMIVVDAETMRIMLVNQHLKTILNRYGRDYQEEILKKNPLDFVHPDDREMVLKCWTEDILQEDTRQIIKFRIIRGDGKIGWISGVASRITYQGRPAGLVSLRDITEQQEAEDALRDSEERFRRLSDQAPDIIFRFSDEKGLEYCSPIVFEITGYTAEELLAEPKIVVELAKAFDAGLPEDYEMSVAKGASMRTREISFVHKDGRRIYLDMRSHAVRDKEGKVIAYEGILRDITERKRMEKELQLLSDAVKMTAESVSIVDLKGRIVDVNEAGLKMQGLENKADLVGKNPFDIIIPEDQPKALETMAKILAERSLQTVEYHIITNDGRKALIETSVSLIRGEKGEPKSIVAVARDITERRKIEEALRESEKRYRLLAENLRDVIWTVDMNWCLTYVSPSVTQLAGYSVEEYMTKDWGEMVAPASVELLTNIFAEELALEARGHSDFLRSRTFEMELKCKDGSTVPVEMKATFLRDPDGRPTGILGVSRDITARRKAEEEKRRMEEQLRLAGRLAAVGELAAGVAHELNNPLTAIKGFAQFLTARKDLDETIRKDLDTIYRESQRAAKITQNLLSFARKHDPEKHPISINDVIENILEMQEHLMKINNIELEVELAPDLPKTMADFHQMQQVFMNIVNNAEQAMVEAHAKGRLVVKTKKTGKIIQISFADNGPGISEENLKRIFDPFFTTKEVGKGTGLGLSICYGIVEAHGGRIYAKSKPRQGATFVVELPIVSENELVAEAALLKPSSRGVKWKKQREPY